MADEPNDLSLGQRLVRWWRKAQPRPRAERDAVLGSLAGQYVTLVCRPGRFSRPARMSGRLGVTHLGKGLVSVAGPHGEGEEWVLTHGIWFVETSDGTRHGPY